MRPQHITAENTISDPTAGACARCFNEAAAYHCGKHQRLQGLSQIFRSFNEAAAYHCGKPNTRHRLCR